MYFLSFVALLLGYACGIATVYLYQWLGRRDEETEAEDERGYTLTVVPREEDGE